MIKNHLHWNEDVWENPDSGMQEDLEAVQTRDVEISSVGTIAPSGLSDEQLQSYLETVSVEINGSDTLLGAQSGALKNINKELQMTGDTSARLGGVDRSLLIQGQEITSQGAEIKKTDINVTKLLAALSGAGADAVKVTADLERLNSQLQEHGEAAPGGLIPAYIEANTRRWKLQEQIDALQSWQIESIKKTMEFNQQISPFTFAPRSTSVVKQGIIGVRTNVNDWNGGFELTNLTDWMDLRVAIGYQQTLLLGSGGFVSDEFTIKPGVIRQYLPPSGNVSYSNLLIAVTPIPLKAFEPPPPPHI